VPARRIAWICPYLPAPENSGGRIRIAKLARTFSSDELHLYARLAPDDPDVPADGLIPWQSIHAERAAPPRWPTWVVPQVALSFPQEVKAALHAHDRDRPFDAVIVEHCYSGHALPSFSRAVVVLSEHNVESEYWRRAIRARPKSALRNTLEYWRWRRFELAMWKRADAITVVSEGDRVRVQQVRSDTGLLVPNGVEPDDYRFIPPSRRTGRAILFVGVLSYLPNIEAACMLARHVLPRIRARFPDATLTLAGRDPHARVRALAGAGVRVTGTLPSIASVYDEHAAFANPIAFGAGSSLKILEPLVAGLPLVGTAFSARGFHLGHGTHYQEANTAEAMAEALCAVLANPSGFDAMAERARLLALRHTWSQIGARYADVVEHAIDSKRRLAA
jgi:glycosyltransferase involved in cell wall biosynthesis